ncbi:MAG: hypothetical protein Kow0062_27760 [Acidobacteriota bacterium]
MNQAPGTGTRMHCRFRTSLGLTYCQEPAYAEGFCRFHYECFLRGELLPNGQINEMLVDQDRRRTINFHGQPQDDTIYVDER